MEQHVEVDRLLHDQLAGWRARRIGRGEHERYGAEIGIRFHGAIQRGAVDNNGLAEAAKNVGGRTLMDVDDWKGALFNAINDVTTTITVNLDGVRPILGSVSERVMSAAGVPNANNFAYEMSELFQTGRLATVNFVEHLGLTNLTNPWK